MVFGRPVVAMAMANIGMKMVKAAKGPQRVCASGLPRQKAH